MTTPKEAAGRGELLRELQEVIAERDRLASALMETAAERDSLALRVRELWAEKVRRSFQLPELERERDRLASALKAHRALLKRFADVGELLDYQLSAEGVTEDAHSELAKNIDLARAALQQKEGEG